MTGYEQGRHDYHAWIQSKHFAPLSKDAPSDCVMKLFLPPVPQDLMQMYRPLPKQYLDWLQGFEREQLLNQKD